ncbi:hypothetical protein DPMN_148311 [Dreissena polymorpha]|uniref:Uncharacterized protein n=1 Tax=Dreissena polymorpha TaxID=45954 RepID=A0A9D4FC91_DREPO|nr:hypothetical protein DPMN_148311 [Dreissena polymorpha]
MQPRPLDSPHRYPFISWMERNQHGINVLLTQLPWSERDSNQSPRSAYNHETTVPHNANVRESVINVGSY